LDAKRDWGHARDYVQGMWMILQQDKPDDYVLATGKMRSVREFVQLAFSHIGIGLDWTGSGVDEKGYDRKTGRVLVEVHPRYFRPTEVDLLLGDATKARIKLGWEHRTSFEDMLAEMMREDLLAMSEGTRRHAAE
jgi:GDPmannose 4,6-dehydratase